MNWLNRKRNERQETQQQVNAVDVQLIHFPAAKHFKSKRLQIKFTAKNDL